MQTKIKNNILWFTILFSVVFSNHSTQFSLVSFYVIVQLIYNLFVLYYYQVRDNFSLYFWFLKVLHLHVSNKKATLW